MRVQIPPPIWAENIMSPYHTFALTLLAGMLATAEPAELTGTPNGSLHLLVDGAEICGFAPFTADAGWKFASATPVGEPGDGPFRFAIKLGKDSIPGEVTASGRDGKADVVWSFMPTTDIAFNALAVSSEFTIPSLAGGTWAADGKSGTFPRVFPGSPGLFGGEVSSLAITYPDGRSLQLSFPKPTYIGMQDNRQWGGQTFTMRVGKAIGKMAANERYDLAMTVAVPQGLTYRRDLPVLLAADAEWIPLKTELDIVSGSALDLSSLGVIDGPCGSKGRVIATPEGHFAYADDPGTPRRFYGVNLCFSAQFMAKEQVDQLLDRLVRLGYNTVRIHHYENGLTNPIWKPGFDWDPGHVDQLDYLMAGCAKRGLWLTTDLYVSRPVPGKQIGLSGDRPDPALYKKMVLVYEPAFQDWATFTRKFLDRVNPYTGMRVAEDPTLAWLSMINEDPVGDGIQRIPAWNEAWNRWLTKTFPDRDALDLALGDLADSEDPAAGSVALPASIKGGTRRARMCQVFIADTERVMIERMRALLRDELKCQALITDVNCGGVNVPMQGTRASTFDYVDDHFYVDHPNFLDQQWHLPSRCPNTNPIREGAPGANGSATMRVWGKPFVISEFDYSGPGRFRGVGGILTGAQASLQDWDAVWRFAYAHKDKDIFTPAPIDYFNLVNDPLNQAADRAAVLLYLRRDLKPAPNRIAAVITDDQVRNPPSRASLAGIEGSAWITRIGCAVVADASQVPRDAVAVPLKSASNRTEVAALLQARGLSGTDDQMIRSETGEISIDRTQGVLTIDTARTAGGYADPGQPIIAANAGVRIDGITTGATVFVTSLGQEAIRSAPRMLVTHLTDLQNTGASYGESARQTLQAWGGLPHLVRAGAATVSISLAEPAAYQVWALSTGGRRVERVPATIVGGALTFTVQVQGSEGARMLYEVVR
jgi:hypothetical protein